VLADSVSGNPPDTEQKFVDALIAGSPDLAPVIALAREFRAMVRRKEAEKLESVRRRGVPGQC
jgi:hypothetical protein